MKDNEIKYDLLTSEKDIFDALANYFIKSKQKKGHYIFCINVKVNKLKPHHDLSFMNMQLMKVEKVKD